MSSDPTFNQAHNNPQSTNAPNTKPGIKFNFKAPTLPPSIARDDNKQKIEVNKSKPLRSTLDQKQHEAVRQRSRSRQKKHYPRQLIIKEKQLQLKKQLQIQQLNQAKNTKPDSQNQEKIISTSEQANKGENKNEKEKEQEQVEQQSQNQLDIPDNDELSKIMGFSTFKSTKNQNHTKSACEGVRKNTQVRRQYRQYMNRRGGFNRNLDKI